MKGTYSNQKIEPHGTGLIFALYLKIKRNKRKIYFDAVGLARAGKNLYAREILKKTYPNATEEHIVKAIEIGTRLNDALWGMADKYYSKKISDEEFKNKIKQICPGLDQIMVDHLFAKALYDAK